MFNDQNINNHSTGFDRPDSGAHKKNNDNKSYNQGIQKETINVYAMPAKFVTVAQRTGHLTTGKVGAGQGRKLLLITISLVLVIIIVIAGVIYFVNGGKERFNFGQLFVQKQNTNSAADQNINENANDTANENVNENVSQNVNANTNDAANENVNQNINENTNQNTNENTNETPNYQMSADTDADGLTSEEELVFGTNPDLEDTDKDGYKDGQEISSLYNPLAPAQDLFSSGLVKKFISASYGYTFFRPSNWTAKVVGTVSNIVILPNSESGESFNIEITPNPEGKSLEQLLAEGLDVFGGLNQYENYSLSGASAYRSFDGRKVLASNSSFVFVISHQVSALGEVSFDNIFEMMLKSFTWTEIENADINGL